jgi:hypothetical protein
MTPAGFYQQVIVPGAAAFPFADAPLSRILLMAIAGQESGWAARLQTPIAYARGYWQFEAGGVDGVIGRPELAAFCAGHDIPLARVHEALAWHDPLAYAVARLTLWLDILPLPAHGDCEGCWTYYVRCWQPGRPRPDDWPSVYAHALAVAP